MGAFQNLGKALRWLRTRQDRKQYEIAENAGITKAMLSAYETGKQNPSIETLEKILEALHVDLPDLHHALTVNRGEGEGQAEESGSWRSAQRQRMRSFTGTEPRLNVYQVLDIDHPLPADQEYALSQMLAGFHSLVRHMYRQLDDNRAGGADAPVADDDAPSAGRGGKGRK
jgi:transcriptional regulator with XRE-family HTH domain